MSNQKKGILMVSFGTSHMDTLGRTIGAIEQAVERAFDDYAVYRAFTSGMIIKKLRTEGLEVMSVEEALKQMEQDGIETLIIQPTHIINGIENEEMEEVVARYRNHFKQCYLGKPLLTSPDDYKMTAHAIMEATKVSREEALVLMGHGTEHHANAAYSALEYTFHLLGFTNVMIGTVEGFPDIKDVINKLEMSEFQKVTLTPLLIVAGDHAKNDILGEDSAMTRLQKRGYEVTPLLRGLGEIEEIQKIFIAHICEAMD